MIYNTELTVFRGNGIKTLASKNAFSVSQGNEIKPVAFDLNDHTWPSLSDGQNYLKLKNYKKQTYLKNLKNLKNIQEKEKMIKIENKNIEKIKKFENLGKIVEKDTEKEKTNKNKESTYFYSKVQKNRKYNLPAPQIVEAKVAAAGSGVCVADDIYFYGGDSFSSNLGCMPRGLTSVPMSEDLREVISLIIGGNDESEEAKTAMSKGEMPGDGGEEISTPQKVVVPSAETMSKGSSRDSGDKSKSGADKASYTAASVGYDISTALEVGSEVGYGLGTEFAQPFHKSILGANSTLEPYVRWCS